MKKVVLLSAAIAATSLAFAQNSNVGIGTTTPNADAKLDITATNKGLLLPRIALTNTANAAPLSAHVAGMTVYNTKDTLDVTKGTYFNNGTKWVRVGDAANAWALSGNANTNPASNFVGTTDSQQLSFRTSNVQRMRIDKLGHVGIGMNNDVTRLSVNGPVFIGKNSFSYMPATYTNMPFLPTNDTMNVLWFGSYDNNLNTTDFSVIYAESRIGRMGTVSNDFTRLNIINGDNFMEGDAVADEIVIANQFHGDGSRAGLIIRDGRLGIGGIPYIDSTNLSTHFYPKAALHIESGDVYVQDFNKGVILKSPNGTCWRIIVNNAGALTTTAVACP